MLLTDESGRRETGVAYATPCFTLPPPVGLPDFQFETIPDGLPESDKDATQNIPTLCDATRKNCYAPFKELINKLNTSSPHIPVTCIIADGNYDFAGRVAKDLGIREIQLWTASTCGFVAYLQFEELVKRGILPFKGKFNRSFSLCFLICHRGFVKAKFVTSINS
ncbi:putative cyanohydrin beta-glucosyltransferase [Medicago truncatula]|uniref:Putative cyanohydrin beta-glucosyltransferase n=1 Tax=Medicago truncatula TaxID=3880 RepID=A0A396IW77_MEDTR|nr:putative cyanohydrin beta-glucosyltransferase [Medicago truncatula]